MFEATRKTEWLDKSVEQIDRMIGNATDPDGDGYLGWSDIAYSNNHLKNSAPPALTGASSLATELLSNGSFETNLNGWTQQGNSAKTYRSTGAGDAYIGSAGLIVESDGTNSNRLVQSIAYSANKTYIVEAYTGVETEATESRIEIYNSTTDKVLAFERVYHIGFQRVLFNFTAPSSGSIQIRLALEKYDASGYKARFDGISVKEVVDHPQEAVLNGTFEATAAGDSTLPANWTRWQSNSTNARVVTGINNFYNGPANPKGLAITTDGTQWRVMEQTIAYTPSQKYLLSFYGRVSDPRYGGFIDVLNATDNTVLSSYTFKNSVWEQHRIGFTAPSAAGKTVKVRLYQAQWNINDFTSYFDVVSVKPVVQKEPAGWSRGSLALANAHATNESGVNPYGDWGLELIHDGTGVPQQLSQELTNYAPSSKYGFRVTAKVSPGASGAIRIIDVTTGSTLGSTSVSDSTSFKDYTAYFDTPVAGHNLRADIYLTGSTPGHKIWISSARAAQSFEFVVHDGMIGWSMLRYVNAVYANQWLDNSYKLKADTYRDFVADNLFFKWDAHWHQLTGTDGSNNGTGVYSVPSGYSNPEFPSRTLPHNQYLALAKMLYLLYDATEGISAYAVDRPKYLSRANDMARAFKSKVTPHPLNGTMLDVGGVSTSIDASFWHYWDAMGSWDDGHYYVSPNEDLSHASLTVSAAYEAYRHGMVFTLSDMQKISRTFTDVMWNQSLSDPVLAYTNDRRPNHTADKLRTSESYDWYNLAEIDQRVIDIIDAGCKLETCRITSAGAIAKWNRNKLVNTGMEVRSPSDNTLPMYWARWQATSTTAYRDDTAPYSENYSATVKTNGTSWQVLEQRIPKYEPNTSYTVKFAGKTNGNVSGYAAARNMSTSSHLGDTTFSNTSWSDQSLSFITPTATSDDVRIRLYHSAYTPTNGIAYFDNVMALPYLYDSHIPNGSFEITDMWDTTRPRFWERGATTSVSNVVVDNSTTSVSGLQSLKLLTDNAGNTSQELIYWWKGYKPNGSYTVTVKGKTNGTNGNGRVKVIDTSNGDAVLVNILVNNSNWTTYSTTFSAPASHDHVLKVIVTHDNPTNDNGTLWVDDLGIYLP
jgi:hypothetical protein